MDRVKSIVDYCIIAAAITVVAWISVAKIGGVGTETRALPADITVGARIPASVPLPDPDLTVIAVVTSTCPYCRVSVPAWNALAERGISVVGLIVSDLDGFSDAANPEFPIYQVASEVFAELGIGAVPRTLVVRKSTVRFVHRGVLRDPTAILDSVVADVDSTLEATAGDRQ